jgi:hypothetical protein
LGLDGIKLVNASPNIIGLSTDSIAIKLHAINSIGLDGARIISESPGILTYAVESLAKKVRTIRAISRLWGYEQEVADNVIENIPQILSHKPGKIRTVATVASELLTQQSEIGVREVQGALMQNIERVVAAYLLHREQINTPADIKRLARRFEKTEPAELREMILNANSISPGDPVLKQYLRAYPV